VRACASLDRVLELKLRVNTGLGRLGHFEMVVFKLNRALETVPESWVSAGVAVLVVKHKEVLRAHNAAVFAYNFVVPVSACERALSALVLRNPDLERGKTGPVVRKHLASLGRQPFVVDIHRCKRTLFSIRSKQMFMSHHARFLTDRNIHLLLQQTQGAMLACLFGSLGGGFRGCLVSLGSWLRSGQLPAEIANTVKLFEHL
jgi:hypothetical protein